MYEKAITTVGRMGIVQDQALANERLAELYMEQRNFSEARHRLEKAIDLYSEWGAKAKEHQLRSRLVTDLKDC